MNSIGTLVRHSLRRRRTFLAAIIGTLFLFQFLLISAGRALHKSGLFSQIGTFLPDFMQGFARIGAMSFQGMVSFGYSHPVVELFLIAMAISITSEPATEIETKFIDVLMARPLPRVTSVHRSIAVLIICTIAAIGSMLVGTFIGVGLLTPAGATPPAPQMILSAALNLACLVLAWGAIALLVATLSNRAGSVTGVCGLVAFIAFVIDYVARIWDKLHPVAVFSPFHYYSPFEMLGGVPLSWMHIGVLTSLFAMAWIAAALIYRARDL